MTDDLPTRPRTVEEWATVCAVEGHPPGFGNTLCCECATAYAAQQTAALQKENDLRKRIIDRLPLCPDHRDKFHDVCVVCERDALQSEADGYHQKLCAEIERTRALRAEVERYKGYHQEALHKYEELIEEGSQNEATIDALVAVATAAQDFWSECWDVSRPTIERFKKALAHPAVQQAVKEKE